MLKIILKAVGVFVGSSALGFIFVFGFVAVSKRVGMGMEAVLYAFAAIPIGVIIGFVLIRMLLRYQGSVLLGLVGSILGLGISAIFLGKFLYKTLTSTGFVETTYAVYAVHTLASAFLGTLGFLLGRLIPEMPSTPKGVQNDNCTKQNNGS